MSRKTESKKERDARLTALMRGVPEGTDLHSFIWEFVAPPPPKGLAALSFLAHPGNDRHAAIACSAVIEHDLKAAITRHLAPGASAKAIFDDYPAAPLSSFDARIRLARGLGIVSVAEEKDLNVIRRVRNIFAHSILSITFHQDDVSSLVSELRVMKHDIWSTIFEAFPLTKDKYVIACGVLHSVIGSHRPHKELLVEAILASRGKSPPPSLPPSRPAHRDFEIP
jgi:hypothetical protein